MRIGLGIDVHKLVEGRDLILAGLKIPHPLGLLGHSDADVLVHAVEDAILGALALGDIGKLFPDTDPKYKGASSIKMLDEVVALMEEAGYYVVNVDVTLIAQAPKLAPYIFAMRENLAKHLKTHVHEVSIKATTSEGMGFEGRKEGITAHAICLLEKETCKPC
ncbi:MAG: 2-C-methyl-D-erythritol 2,4-cyclodiphosphate synthase [Tissierellia bacterium]|nr:2-C-methyl-D-erythritol 2,4-cyclodiphosphate synthase [Tissierellia bacterium]